MTIINGMLTRRRRSFNKGQIPATQVTVLAATNFGRGPLCLVEMRIADLTGAGHKEINARYDLGKAIFIDVFPDDHIMYQLRRVELAVGQMLTRAFKT